MHNADVNISNCSNIQLKLPVPMQALFIRGLKDCIILAGPVAGSVHIQDCSDCVLAIACHQVLFVMVMTMLMDS